MLHATKVDLSQARLIVVDLGPPGPRASRFLAELHGALAAASLPRHLRQATVLDAYPVLARDDYFVLDEHLNARGHRVVAEALVGAIRKLDGDSGAAGGAGR